MSVMYIFDSPLQIGRASVVKHLKISAVCFALPSQNWCIYNIN